MICDYCIPCNQIGNVCADHDHEEHKKSDRECEIRIYFMICMKYSLLQNRSNIMQNLP